MSSLYSVGQMNQLGDALERSGYTPADVTQLSGGDILANVLPLVRAYGKTPTVAVQNLIDCDANPFEPSGLKVHSHTKGGQYTFDPNVTLYLSEKQKSGGVIEGNKLLKELANKHPLNANVLDYLLKNTHLIPESWKGKYVYFFGTVYRDSRGNLYVRYLFWDGEQWFSFCHWLDNDWYSNNPVALRAS